MVFISFRTGVSDTTHNGLLSDLLCSRTRIQNKISNMKSNYSTSVKHATKSSKNILLYLMEAEMFLVLGGAMGLTTSASITELSASSKTSRGLFGLNSRGVSKSTLPESTRESLLLTFDTAPPLPLVAMRRRVGVGVSRFPELLSSSGSHAC